jgi:type VI protein secretion system component Hcp
VFTGGAAAREGSAPSVSEITITKATDKASVSLFQQALGGGPKKPQPISIVFENVAVVGAPGPRHTLAVSDAVITQVVPYNPPSPRMGARKPNPQRQEKVTFRFSEYHFDGIRNAPVPHTLNMLRMV